MALRLRSARAADAAEIAALHLASWRDVYRGLLEDAFLDGPAEGLIRQYWREALAVRRRSGVVLLATAGGDSVGFIAVWRDGPTAFIDNLHVRPGMRGAGIGRALLGMALGRMQGQGCTEVALVCLAGNAGGLRFYRELGAEIGPEEEGETFGQRVIERRCTWDRLQDLLAAVSRAKVR